MNPAIVFFLLFLLPLFLLMTRRNSKRLPPGPLGLPIIGQTFSFVHAMRNNRAEQWLQDRIRKYGPIWKMSILGGPTVFLYGQAANKFIYTCDSSILTNQQPSSVRMLCGEKNILELSGDEHKRVRGALVSFLKPEVLKQYVGKMDGEIRQHFDKYWHGNQKVLAMPLMKTLTFNIICSLIFGIEQGAKRDIFIELFEEMLEGLLSVPINLPFTQFNRSLRASAKIRTIVMEVVHKKKAALEQQTSVCPQQDLISSLLTLQNEDGSAFLSDEEIVDNAVLMMIAGYDTTSVLLSCLIRLFAKDASVCANIVQEQEEIAKNKAFGDVLTWDDLAKMKYTWRVAMETLRITPPVFNFYRKVLKDFEYEGYLIPKGWQVTWATCMTHMDQSIFPDPSKFDPKHFEKQTSLPRYSFVAFGGGSRICPGNEFSRIETLITIHYLVNSFTWKLCCPDSPILRNPLFLFFKDGLEIAIEPKVPAVKIN